MTILLCMKSTFRRKTTHIGWTHCRTRCIFMLYIRLCHNTAYRYTHLFHPYTLHIVPTSTLANTLSIMQAHTRTLTYKHSLGYTYSGYLVSKVHFIRARFTLDFLSERLNEYSAHISVVSLVATIAVVVVIIVVVIIIAIIILNAVIVQICVFYIRLQSLNDMHFIFKCRTTVLRCCRPHHHQRHHHHGFTK